MPDASTTAMGAGWFPLLTALLGYLTSAISERFRDERALKRDKAAAAATSVREREARTAARRDLMIERRIVFQRETLLNLQDAIVKLTRAAGRMHHLDEIEHRKSGKWAGMLFPDDLDASSHEANVTIMVLTARVRDDRIRELVTKFRSHANRVGISKTREADLQALEGMSAALEPLHERIGEVLRTLDDDEAAVP